MSRNIIETIVGFIVLAIAAIFIIISYQSGSIKLADTASYRLFAQFDRADGINFGSDVKLSGIAIGKVMDMRINPTNYDAEVELLIESKYAIPIDSSAEIIGNGLLGEKYIAIVPGSDEEHLTQDDRIEFTQSSISLESLIGKFIFGSADAK